MKNEVHTSAVSSLDSAERPSGGASNQPPTESAKHDMHTFDQSNGAEATNMDTFLPPIEKPRNLIIKLAYFWSRRQFGKVLTPLKVANARLPVAFGFFYSKIGKLDKKLTLPAEFVLLIRERVAHINVCRFCMDIARSFVVKASMDEARFDELEQYRTSPLFTDAERAALDYVTELTRDKEVNPATFARMSQYYSERAICEIVWVVATEHLYNISNIGLNIHSDLLCDIRRKKQEEEPQKRTG